MTGFYLSPSFCAANQVIVLDSRSTGADIGMVHPEDTILRTRIEKTYPWHQFTFTPINENRFHIQLSRLYSEEKSELFSPTDSRSTETESSDITRIADDAPAVNLLNTIFLEALEREASDIHIESENGQAHIRFRIDGILIPDRTIPEDRAAAVSARLKLLANLNILETRRPQDGHIDITTGPHPLDIRISVTPTIWGESIVLRLLNRTALPLTPEALGFTETQQQELKKLLRLSAGLILLTGPTGSGKTTTLASLLNSLDKKEKKIISIEDPVEYRIPGIIQIQTNEELDLTFNTILRRIFRQDPDIIMIGEIRDTDTAELAVRAALTGHLVFATLHTTNAPEAIYRLQDMGIPPYLAGTVIKAVIAQRLVRKKCPRCGTAGCTFCSSTGYRGRTVIAEFLHITEELSEYIAEGTKNAGIREYLTRNNHQTLFDEGRRKIAQGVTDTNEVERELGPEL